MGPGTMLNGGSHVGRAPSAVSLFSPKSREHPFIPTARQLGLECPRNPGCRKGGGPNPRCPPLTFVLEDVLGVGQHAGEGATQEQAQTCCPREQEDDVVGENKQEQECHHHAHLLQQRWKPLETGQSWASTEEGGKQECRLQRGVRRNSYATLWTG